MKLSYLGCGSPILLSKHADFVKADKRLTGERLRRANQLDELATISFQKRLLEAQMREEQTLKEVTNDDV